MKKTKHVQVLLGCLTLMSISSGAALFATGSGSQGCTGSFTIENCPKITCSGPPNVVPFHVGGNTAIGASCDHGNNPASCGGGPWDCGEVAATGNE